MIATKENKTTGGNTMETLIICMLAMAGGYAVRVAQEIERR